MVNTQKFFDLAVRESNASFYDSAEEDANILLMGMIEQSARSQEEFMQAAITYVDLFDDLAKDTIQKLKEKQQNDGAGALFIRCQNSIEYIQQLALDAINVDRNNLAQIAATDWQERHSHSEYAENSMVAM